MEKECVNWLNTDFDTHLPRLKRIVVDADPNVLRNGIGDVTILVKDLDGNFVFCTRAIMRALMTVDVGDIDFPVWVRVRVKTTQTVKVKVWFYA